MPFPDEVSSGGISVVDYRSEWVTEFERIAELLRSTFGDRAVSVDHVGSTSVPGLPAKDCIDVQVRVSTLDGGRREVGRGDWMVAGSLVLGE